jgi:glycosyltransferase involved in cell wall biosynthesis
MNPLAIVHTESSLGWGGQEIRILSEAEAMLKRGHRITLITPAASEIYPAAKRIGIPVVALDIAKKSIAGVMQMRNWLRTNGSQYDIVNCHSSTDSWITALASVALADAPRLIRTRHVSTPINNNPATRWLYTRATAHIVTTGESLREQLHRQNGYALSKMTSVRTGIDLAKFSARDQQAARQLIGIADRPTLGIVATLRDWKGHEDLLDSLVLLRDQSAALRDWQLIIVGDGPERARLIEKVARRALGDVVKLVGNQENVAEWLSAFDIFVLPSYGNEGVPQGIMQAMACGLPVVSTPVGAIAEAVEVGKSGLLVPTRNPPALAAALQRLMTDGDQRRAMGDAGHAIATEKFGIDVMVEKMEGVFRQYAHMRQRPPA